MSLFMFIHYLFEVFALVNKDRQWCVIEFQNSSVHKYMYIDVINTIFPTRRHLQNCIQIFLISSWNYRYSWLLKNIEWEGKNYMQHELWLLISVWFRAICAQSPTFHQSYSPASLSSMHGVLRSVLYTMPLITSRVIALNLEPINYCTWLTWMVLMLGPYQRFAKVKGQCFC